MNRVIVDLIALLLPPCDREAVRGDVAESNAPLASSLMAILGFALRRQLGQRKRILPPHGQFPQEPNIYRYLSSE